MRLAAQVYVRPDARMTLHRPLLLLQGYRPKHCDRVAHEEKLQRLSWNPGVKHRHRWPSWFTIIDLSESLLAEKDLWKHPRSTSTRTITMTLRCQKMIENKLKLAPCCPKSYHRKRRHWASHTFIMKQSAVDHHCWSSSTTRITRFNHHYPSTRHYLAMNHQPPLSPLSLIVSHELR